MKKIALILSFLIVVAACSSGDNGNKNSSGSGDGFDRTALLTNWADNIIIPAYQNYQSKVQDLTTVTNTFVAEPTEANLQAVRTSWIEAYKAYQYISMYNFGKALDSDVNFGLMTNTYPTNANGIDTNIASGTYDLSKFSQFDKQGLPALDYIVNGLAADDASIVAFYTANSNATNYKKYLTDLVGRLKTNIDLVYNNWTSTYRSTYVSNNGNSQSSSVNITTNAFAKNIEKDIRAGKVGIPAGKFSAGVLPGNVEAFYKNDISKDLLNASIKASQDFFNGKHFASDVQGPSLKSYLDYLNATKDDKKLSDVMNNQYANVFSVNTALNNSLAQQINTDNTKMLASYDALQALVVLAKIDMVNALKITIDYVDNDGD